MTISIETLGGASANLAKVRRLIQDSYARDLEAARLGVGSAALLVMLLLEQTRIAALT
jgi:hypothetical protein